MDDHFQAGSQGRALRPQTQLVRGGTRRSSHGETSEALFLNSGFVYETAESAEARFNGDAPGYVYSRYGNPTVSVFEERMALLEGMESGFATASGMAAVFAALMCQLNAGDHVVASRALFGSCHHIVTKILPRFGIETSLVDGGDLEQWRAAIRDGTRCVFFETPSNPTLDIIDIRAVANMAHQFGARVVIDNALASPVLQRPGAFGADVVVYSGTKHIDGQGRCLGGMVLSDLAFRHDLLEPFIRHTGPALSPFNAWVLLKGLETLDLRVERHCDTAELIATLLAGHPKVSRVYYPHLENHRHYHLARAQMRRGGTVVSFDVAGGRPGAFAFMNGLGLVDISNNLGDTKSLITHPATTTHRALSAEEKADAGIGDGLVRLSVGLEDPQDLLEDIAAALDRPTG